MIFIIPEIPREAFTSDHLGAMDALGLTPAFFIEFMFYNWISEKGWEIDAVYDQLAEYTYQYLEAVHADPDEEGSLSDSWVVVLADVSDDLLMCYQIIRTFVYQYFGNAKELVKNGYVSNIEVHERPGEIHVDLFIENESTPDQADSSVFTGSIVPWQRPNLTG